MKHLSFERTMLPAYAKSWIEMRWDEMISFIYLSIYIKPATSSFTNIVLQITRIKTVRSDIMHLDL